MLTLVKFLHLLGACLFVGNVIVSGLWKALADRHDSLELARFATRLVNLTDLCFTAGGATLLALTGHLLAQDRGGVLANDWIVASYVSFGLSGALWLFGLLPIQLRQARLLAEATTHLPTGYRRLSRLWAMIGVPATLLGLPPLLWMGSQAL